MGGRLLSVVRPSADPKGPPFSTFKKFIFGRPTLKFFLKTPFAPIYNSFEGERAPKKKQFFSQSFPKSVQNFFDLVFHKFAYGAEKKLNLAQKKENLRKLN